MLQNPHAHCHPVWGTLSRHHCMHCHSNHALQHSQQVLSVSESRGFCAMELLAPSPLAPSPLEAAQGLSIPITPVVGLGPAVSPCARSHTLIQLPSRSSLTAVPSAIAEVFSPPIPRMWGATPVAAEVGCGTGVRLVSRRVALANPERRGASLRLRTTLMASCTLMSSACEKTTTLLSRCLVEPGTAAAQEWVATWPCLL